MADFVISENLKVHGTIKDSNDDVLAGAPSVEVSKNSAVAVGERRTLNLIEGTNITLTIADDSGGDEIDVTIAASGSTTPTQYEGDYPGTTVTSSSSADTYGSYVEIIASTSFVSEGIWISICSTNVASVNAGLAVATGAATSESDIIEPIQYQGFHSGSGNETMLGSTVYSALFEVAVSSRIALRIKDTSALAETYSVSVGIFGA